MRHALACLLLVMTGSPAAGDEVRQAPFAAVVADLQSQDPAVRVRALRQLDASGYPEAAEAVSALARDPEDGIQTEAIGATLRLLVGARLPGTDGDFSGALAAFAVLAGRPALERAATLYALARIGHPSSLALFTAALDDRGDAVRQLGYEGLAALGHREADVRAALAEVLGLAGTRDALAPLTPLASERSRTMAEAAARAISRIEAGLSSGTPRPR